MPKFFRTLLRWLAYLGATLIVLLAIAVGLFRLLVPELPEYREEIERRVSAAAGVNVRFTSLDARWRLRGPELIGNGVTATDPASGERLIAAERMVVGASVYRLATERRVVIKRLELGGATVDLGRDGDGRWLIGSVPIESLGNATDNAASSDPVSESLTVILTELTLNYTDPAARRNASSFSIGELTYDASRSAAALAADLVLLGDNGNPVAVEADRTEADGPWHVFLKADDTNIGAYLRTLPASWPVPDDGAGSLELWLTLDGAKTVAASADFDLKEIAVPLPASDAEPINVGVAGHAEWADRDGAIQVGFDFDRLSVGDSAWPATRGEVRLSQAEPRELKLKVEYLRFDDLALFADWMPEPWRERIRAAEPRGNLYDATLSVSGWESDDILYDVDARFDALSWQPVFGAPGLDGVSGQLAMDRVSGRLTLAMDAFTVKDERLFPEPVRLSSAQGSISWHQSRQGLTLISDSLRVASPAFETDSHIELTIPVDGAISIDLDSRFSVGDLNAARDYLPRAVMPEPSLRWFDMALVAGRLESGIATLKGPLQEFPFDNGNGRFEVSANVVDTTLKFAPPWPPANVEFARASLTGLRLYSDTNKSSLLGNPSENAVIEIADLRKGVLTLKAEASTDAASGLALVRESPLRKIFGDTAGRLSADGAIDYTLDLVYPIKDKTAWEVDAELSTDDLSFALAPLQQRLTKLNGSARITRDNVSSRDLTAVILGSPVAIEVLSADRSTGYAAVAVVSGAVTARGMRNEIPAAALGVLGGATDYRATVRFPLRNPPGDMARAALEIQVDSDLQGLAIDAPEPLGKGIETARKTGLTLTFPEAGRIDIAGSLEDAGAWHLVSSTGEGAWAMQRGAVELGGRAKPDVRDDGVYITGSAESLRFQDWLDFIKRLQLPQTDEPVIRGLRIRADELYAYGQRVDDVTLQADRNPSEWMIQLDSAAVDGAIFVPADLASGDAVVLRMQRLHLLNADDADSDDADPRDVPPLVIDAEDFVLGERRFGRLLAEFTPSERGLEASRLQTTAAAFRTDGAASWFVDDDDAQHCELTLDIASSDTAAATAALGIEMGIIADSAAARIDVSWNGPPRADFFDSLDGEFSVRVADGRLDEVDPGAGRVLGLMSVVEIPRRLSLDFRDVFAKGLTFDQITADYRLVNGEAFTCNLSLTSPAADIALIGRASLTRRDYNQTVVVSANVGNTLPAVGAVVGGPQVAAAMLVISRIFKRPLKGLGQAYYQINGSWDDPSIERTTVERFYATSQLADCLQSQPQ